MRDRLRAVVLFAVPELTRSANIQLNERHFLKLIIEPLSCRHRVAARLTPSLYGLYCYVIGAVGV